MTVDKNKLLCRQCGGAVDVERCDWATPVCTKCLPPPEPLRMNITKGLLTDRQALERVIASDARNVEFCRSRFMCSKTTRMLTIADCAQRMFWARDIAPDLVEVTEKNLRDALRWWV